MGIVGEFGFERRSDDKGLGGEDSLKEDLARGGGGERLERDSEEIGREGAFCEGRVRGASVRTAGRGAESVRRGV